MLKAILNNPYRILGVYANSPKKEQIANKGKMQAFLRVGRSMDFPLDLKGILPLVNRTQEVVDQAESELALPTDQVKHAQFWFVNVTPIDHIAFNHLFQGNLDEAMSIWQKQVNASSLQNLFVCHLIRVNYLDAINLCATPLYNDYTRDFLKAIDENASVRAEDLIESVIEVMSQEKVITTHLISNVEDKDWSTRLETIEIKPIIEELERDIEEAKSVNEKDVDARLQAGQTLMEEAKRLLDILISIIPTNNFHYQTITDKVCNEILNCAIDYYNQSQDREKASKSISLYEFTKDYAVGNEAKKRAEINYETIKNAIRFLPPQEVKEETIFLKFIIGKFSREEKSSANAVKMLIEASELIVAIKEKLGKTHKFYLEMSTQLADAALNMVIDNVIDALKVETGKRESTEAFGSGIPFRVQEFEYSWKLEYNKKLQKAYKIRNTLKNA